MKAAIIFLIVLASCLLLVGCGSRTFEDRAIAMNHEATVIVQTNAYTDISMSNKVGTLSVGESVDLTHRTSCGLFCRVESGGTAGWVECKTLEISE